MPYNRPVSKGKMAELVQSKDWSKTPLGPIETWPQSLKTTVSLCLASNFPISIAWGPHRVQIYNDGYWPICGDKHPTSMGQDYKECWLSAWPVIGPAFEEASLGQTRFLENQRMFLDRYGYLEETFFTFSFSPILDESGGVGGLFHPVTELTQQTLAERRLNILSTLSDRTVDAKAVEEAIILILYTLQAFDLDLPFVALYSVTDDGTEAKLEGSVGVKEGSALAASKIQIGERKKNWPFAEVLQKGKAVHVAGLQTIFENTACGPYPEPLKEAMVFPIALPGAEKNTFFLVAGVSARRSLDEKYALFYELLTASITNALTKARAYDEERKRAEALAELDRAKTAFFSNISHEFRTPLTLMLGPLEDLLSKRGSSLGQEERDQLDLVQRNTLRLQRLVNSLLEFSKIESDRLDASYQETDVAVYTSELASVFRSAMEKAGLDFRIDCQPQRAAVFVDQGMWEKIVFNLLSNALKFTFAGSVEISLKEEGEVVVLQVKDTGEGIPENELPNLFKRFYRVEGTKSRTHEGSGIGLAFVQELVKLHGGTISAESKKGVGTTFTVRLPKGKAHLPAEKIVTGKIESFSIAHSDVFLKESMQWLSHADLTPANGFDKNNNDTATILVVDDNADMRRYISRVLAQKKSWNILIARDGIEALEAVRNHTPQLILSDIMMPRMDGYGLLKKLKETEETACIPVIFLSARAGEEATVEGLEQGADDYLVKPFSAKELLARVQTQLEITVTRQDNTALRETEEELRKFKILSDHAFDAFILMREDSSFAYLNDLALERWGYTKEEATTLRVPDVDPIYQAEIFNEAFALAQKQIIPPFETLHKRKDGSIYPVEVSMGGITLGGKPHMFAVARDITERKKNEEALLSAKERLESEVVKRTAELQRSNEDLQQFAHVASHDLKEPLRKIKTFSGRLLDDGGTVFSPKGKLYLEKVNSAADRMYAMIEGVLTYSTTNTAEQRIEEVNLNTVIGDVKTDLELLIQQKDAAIQCGTLPAIEGSVVLLYQLFYNLVNNSLKFASSERQSLISISSHVSKTNQDYVEITVADNGIGFDPQYAEKIFDTFSRLNSKDRFEGTGLGLSLCRKIVQRHGGTITAKGEQDKGAAFTIRLPVKQHRTNI